MRMASRAHTLPLQIQTKALSPLSKSRRRKDMDVSMADNWNKRYRENMQRIKSGDLTELAAVIKALTQRDEKRPLSTGERRMLNQARQILLSEISLSVNCPYDFAEAQLDQCLRKPNKRSVLNR